MSKKFIALVAAAAFLLQTIPVYADGPGRHGGGFRESPRDFHPSFHHDYVAHRLPSGYISLLVGGLTLLYCEGLYYRYSPAGYVVVQPPVGAVVPSLPPGYTMVIVNNRPYYMYGYTYYDYTPSGYMVINPPAYAPQTMTPVVAAPQPVMQAPTVQAAAQTVQAPAAVPAPAVSAATAPVAAPESSDVDSFEIHLPNGDGSFTLVTLKKTSTGFLGPQGEFYPDHPTVDQLKDRYISKKKV